MKASYVLTVRKAVLWTAAYFGVMLLYTTADLLFWQRLGYPLSDWLNLAAIILFSSAFIGILSVRTSFKPELFEHLDGRGIAAAVLCAAGCYLLLDLCLDPLLEGLFPASEQAYQESLEELAKSPAAAFVHICIVAPVIEELLMRL